MNAADEKFWNDGIEDSLLHCPSGYVNRDLLVIWVHGYGGSASDTWQNLARWSHAASGVEATSFSFGYSTAMVHRTSIGMAADRLRRLVLEHPRLRDHKSMVFIAHSTGAIIVKRLLHDDITLALNAARGEDPLPAIAMRTRAVLYFPGAHHGATIFLSVALLFKAVINAALTPLLFILNLVGSGKDGKAKGLNLLLWQLMWKNPSLSALDRRYRAMLREVEEGGTPIPEIVDLSLDG